MKHNEFSIGTKFTLTSKLYLCTDVGTRVIVAVCLDKDDTSWYNGPPYAVAESVLDEHDLPVCRIFK